MLGNFATRIAREDYSFRFSVCRRLFRLGKKIVRGLYDYTTADGGATGDIPDLDFKKGDIMEVIQE